MYSSVFVTLLAATSSAQRTGFKIGQTAYTTSGEVTGQASGWKNHVSEYLGVPFAKAPVGDLRWAAPQKITGASDKVINATKHAFSCAESASWASRNDPNRKNNIGQSENEQSEDCLYLNIWSKPQTGDRRKAVMIWIYGGGFVVGSASNQAYNGALLADEHDVVVVGVNYRLGALGFPSVPLPEHNLGLLDQRAAVEWLRDNVDQFGGDPRRMILFGQSAGGVSTDLYAHAYTNDPIIKGFIPQSGSAVEVPVASRPAILSVPSAQKANAWSTLSQKLGCPAVTANAISSSLSCMRNASTEAVLKATASDGMKWGLSVDGKTFPADIQEQRANGKFIQVPMLVGNVNNELAGRGTGATAGSTAAKRGNCESVKPAEARRRARVPVWRYLYSAEFANNVLGGKYPNETGAWHGSEIALIFGTTELKNKGKDTENEKKLGQVMRTAWTAFAKNPEVGLTQLGWPMWNPNTKSVVVLGAGGKDSAEVKFELPANVDINCNNNTSILLSLAG